MTEDGAKESSSQTGAASTGAGQSGSTGAEERKFTQTDMDNLAGKVRAEARATFEREAEEKRKQEDINKLEGEQRIKAQFEADLEKERTARAEAERALGIAKAGVELSKLGYDPEFAELMVGKDDAETEANIKRLDQMITQQVSKIVNANLKKGAPPVSNGESGESNKLRDMIFKAGGVEVKKEVK